MQASDRDPVVEFEELKIQVVNEDALAFSCDVLVLKYAQGLHGVDRAASDRLGIGLATVSLPPGGFRLYDATDSELAPQAVLFVGVVALRQFRYREIREFSAKALRSLAGEAPNAAHIALTLHGPGYGLDERECFLAEIAGIVDATNSGDLPRSLRMISFVETNPGRSSRMLQLLEQELPGGIVERDSQPLQKRLSQEQSILRSVGFDSSSKPLVFVAMPINSDTEDRFHYGIEPSIDANGYLCERIDKSPGTGDLVDRIKQTIDRSSIVVADLTGSNPNVFLEVGYAWGKEIDTVLLINKEDVAMLPFDVRTQTCVVYDSIHDLEHKLSATLKKLIDD